MKIGKLAQILDYDLVGDPELEITDIACADCAKKSSIALIRNKKEIQTTLACAVVTAPCFINTSKALLFTYDKIDYAMIKICQVLIEAGDIPDYAKPVSYEMKEKGIGFGKNVCVGGNLIIEPNTLIGNNVKIDSGTRIGAGVVIGSGTQIGKNVYISSGSVVGADSFFHYRLIGKRMHFQGIGKVVIGNDVYIGNNSVIQRGTIANTVISDDCMIGNCVDIGHDVVIGKGCKIVSQCGIAGNAVIGDNVLICGQSGISNGVQIGNNATIKGKSLVSRYVPDGCTVFGLYGRSFWDELKLQAKIRKFFQ